MGGKSKSTQTTSNLQTTNNYVNDGDYAGVIGGVTHDESEIDFQDDHSVRNDIDNSVRNEYEFDYEDSSDHSVRNDIDNSIRNDIDNSVQNDYEDNSDHSVSFDGDYAGAGTVNILDGGAIEQSFDFATSTVEENSAILRESISAVTKNSTELVDALVDSQSNAFSSYDKVVGDSFGAINQTTQRTLDTLEKASGDYASNLTDFASDFVEGITDTQVSNSDNNKEQLATIAELAKNTSLQGQDIVAENSTKMVMYFMGAVAFIALIGSAVVLVKGNK
ncbi:MAG: hypothetical protein OCD00_03080 [Colwellia sp.]